METGTGVPVQGEGCDAGECLAVASGPPTDPLRAVLQSIIAPLAGEGRPGGEQEAAGWVETIGRLSRLLEGVTEHAIVMLDAEGCVRSWGESAQQLLHGSDEDVVGSAFDRFFAPDEQDLGVPQQILTTARTVGRAQLCGQQRRADGTEFWSRWVLTAVHGGRGEPVGFVCVVRDLTRERALEQQVSTLNEEVRALNEELERRVRQRTDELESRAGELGFANRALEDKAEELALANRELEAFSYSVSHDLRAPLRAMSGFAQLLEEDHSKSLDTVGLHYVARIGAAARQMSQLIDDLLAFSRLMRQQLARETLDMNVLVMEAWRMVRPAGSTARLEVTDLPQARGDRQLVLEVWQNLLENAVKFSRGHADPLVRVSGVVSDGVASYTVSDNGVGFDMHFVDKLFRPFQRLHRAEDFPGTGIGLALVDRIVRRHGGAVEAHGRLGDGASFRFTLDHPTADPPPAPGTA